MHSIKKSNMHRKQIPLTTADLTAALAEQRLSVVLRGIIEGYFKKKSPGGYFGNPPGGYSAPASAPAPAPAPLSL